MLLIDALTWYQDRGYFKKVRIKRRLSILHERVIIGVEVVDVETESTFGDHVHGEYAENPAGKQKESC